MYLNCHTGFSFKYGTLPIEGLFNEAKRCGVHKLILTEINNTASYLEMLRICAKNKTRDNGLTQYGKEPYDLEIGVGVEFRIGDELLYIAIAKNNAGFEEINRFLSHHNREKTSLPRRAPFFENVFIIYPFGRVQAAVLRNFEYIGVRKKDINIFALSAERHDYIKRFVAWHPVSFLPPENQGGKLLYKDHNIHRLLRCIEHNTLLSKLAEHQQGDKDEYMLPHDELKKYFEAFPELISNTERILAESTIECKLYEDKNKRYFSESKENDVKILREETARGFERRYGNNIKLWNER